MTQNATVLQILEDGRARIVVARQSACAHDCSQCGGCGATVKPVYALAVNEIGAAAGDLTTADGRSWKHLAERPARGTKPDATIGGDR